MFNNLIESSSHTREYKRRGSFLLFTTGIYAVLLVLGGVASIYAYDARLEERSFRNRDAAAAGGGRSSPT